MDIIFIIIIFILGITIGSFLNVCIYRIPQEISIISPPSRCSSCNTRLKPLDLVPVFSWLMLGGKCRHCRAKVSIRYLFVELLTGALFVLVFSVIGLNFYLLAALILTSVLIVTTFIDIDTQTIPNGLMIFGLICAIILVFARVVPNIKDGYWANALDALLGSIVGFTPLLFVNIISKLILKKDGMGGGDMKLMAVVGLFLGLKFTIIALITAIYSGGLVGAIILIGARINKTKDKQDQQAAANYMPFGPFLALGCFISMLFGSNIFDWYISILF